MNKTNFALGLAVVAVVIAIVAVFHGGSTNTHSFGGTTNYDALQTSKLTVGTSGTGWGTILAGTCTLLNQASYTASTTVMVDCQSSSFAVGDSVIITGLATSSTDLTRQFAVLGTGSASTTAGFAPVRIENLSGGTVTPAGTGFGSSTPFFLFRPLSSTPGL